MGIADGALTSIALCWRLERKDGAGIGLTSHDAALIRDGAAFQPSPGMVPAAISRSLGLDAHSSETGGAISSEALDASDLSLGRWDGAQCALTAVDWRMVDAEPITLLGGEIGSVAIEGERFSAEFRGASALLEDPVCPATSAECRAHFGDRQCRVDLAGRTVRATVIAASGAELTFDEAFDERFVLGRLRFLSGANCGMTNVILAVSGATIQLRDMPRGAIEQGCLVELREGCDKRFETCVSRFANAINFRGEPHLPGTDLLTRYPGA
ncbi:MAG: DUF2163 domain-containing protein [Sphingomicrobium sp.]